MKYITAGIIIVLAGFSLYKIIQLNLFLNLAIGRKGGRYKKNGKKRNKETAAAVSYESELAKELMWLDTQAQEEVTIMSQDRYKLVGRYIPAGLPQRLLIMFHGWHGSWRRDFGMCARAFLKEGSSLLCVEQRAQGKSEGKYIGFGILERFDCMSWIRYAEKRFGTELPVYLYGVSMGASTVLMASGRIVSEAVKGVIADSGFTSAYDMVVQFGNRFLHKGEYPDIPRINRMCRRRAGYDLKDYTTLDSMKTCRIPVLFIHGIIDDFVPYYMTLENYHACTSEKQLLLVEGAGHCRSFVQNRDAYMQAVSAFFGWDGADKS